MKIALLGNMNNLNFCIMRYLRDLGMDAYLLMYKDEQHVFLPECDTYELARWNKYIVQTSLPNSRILGFLSISAKKVRQALEGYDFYIGNGLAPAYFHRAKMKLDLFIPYAVGVEKVMHKKLKLVWKNPRELAKSVLIEIYRRSQLRGLIHNTRAAISMDVACINLLEEIGVPTLRYGVVPLYNAEINEEVDSKLMPYIDRMKKSGLVIYSHVSHIYKNIHPLYDIKKNYILIEGFAHYLQISGNKEALLVMHEYGKDVNSSKKTIKDLGIANQVMWIPHLKRKQIMKLLEYVDIGGGEFGGVIWGSTGIEFLSKGIPFFQSVDLTEKEFEDSYHIPMPPIINVDKPKEISEHIRLFQENPQVYKQRGEDGKLWYDRYNGISLARQYKDLINKMHSEVRKAQDLQPKKSLIL